MRPSLVILLATALLALACERGQGSGPGRRRAAVSRRRGLLVSLLGTAPGAGGGSFSGNVPGTGRSWGDDPGATDPKGDSHLGHEPRGPVGPTASSSSRSRRRSLQPISPSSAPLYGTLEIPAGPEDDGPADGLTLDRAIDITLERSLDLRAKYFEIPQARADILQASLRANPVFYRRRPARPVPGQFSRAVPAGRRQYDTNITYPLDVSHKRQARTLVATRAEKVLEAQYQEAVRQRIDDIYDAYVLGTLAARQTLRYARQSVKGLERLAARTEELYQGQEHLSRATTTG